MTNSPDERAALLERLKSAFADARYPGERAVLFLPNGERVFWRNDPDLEDVLNEAERVADWTGFTMGIFRGQTMILLGPPAAFPFFLAAVMHQCLLDPDLLDATMLEVAFQVAASNVWPHLRAGLDSLNSEQLRVLRDFLRYFVTMGWLDESEDTTAAALAELERRCRMAQ